MFGRNLDKLITNSALKAMYRVKHHPKRLKLKRRSSELQGLSCRNNRSSGVYIYAFICIQYLKHTQLLWRLQGAQKYA